MKKKKTGPIWGPCEHICQLERSDFCDSKKTIQMHPTEKILNLWRKVRREASGNKLVKGSGIVDRVKSF